MKKERKEIDIALLRHPEKNTRIHPEKQIAEIRRSLRKWGQYKNAVVDDQNVVLAGNGMVEAMRAEGMQKVTAIVLHGLSENDKKKLMLADNKTAGLGIDDLGNIEKIIAELAGDFDIPGFDDEILGSINAASEEISRALEEYGKASDGNLADMETRSGVNEGEGGYQSEETSYGEEPDAPQELAKRTIVCPNCGTEIWL